jgi:hypothetical protein
MYTRIVIVIVIVAEHALRGAFCSAIDRHDHRPVVL